MKCHKCNSSGDYKYVDKWLCKRDFLDIIEKNVRKNLRVNHTLEKDDNLLVVGPICKWFIEKIITIPCSIKYKDELSDLDLKKDVTLVLPVTMDDVGAEFLSGLFDGSIKKKKVNTNVIRLFYNLSEEALVAFCKLKKIDYKRSSTEEKNFLDKMESKYPGTKNSLLKTVEKLENED